MPRKPEEIHRTLSMIPVMIQGFVIGIQFGWLAPVLKNSESSSYAINLTQNQRSWVASLHLLFLPCGLIICGAAIDRIGRKNILLCSSLCNLLGWALIRFTKWANFIYWSRAMLGIMAGLGRSAVVIIIGENSLPDHRGVYTCIQQICMVAGIVTQYASATYISYNTVANVNLAIGLLFLLSIFLLKETVQFLILSGRHRKAEQNYRWLFSGDATNFEVLMRHTNKDTGSALSLAEFFEKPAYYKSVAIALLMTVLTYSTGYQTLRTYASIAFSSSTTLKPNELTICYGLITLTAAFGSSFFMVRLNRRTLLLTALAASALTNLISAGLYYANEKLAPIPYFPWLIFATICLFTTLSGLGLHPTIFVLQSELFPQKVKPLGVVLTNLGGIMTVFVTSLVFLKVSDAFGIYTNFLYYSIMCCVTFAFTYTFLPETKGKSLLEIQRMFEVKSDVSVE